MVDFVMMNLEGIQIMCTQWCNSACWVHATHGQFWQMLHLWTPVSIFWSETCALTFELYNHHGLA